MDKITGLHLSREAYVYIRQSSPCQVMKNVESQRVQRKLVLRAEELGWEKAKVIDRDLGRSATDGRERGGFERLLCEVSEENVGAIFAFEASRLARTGREWHTLLDLCGVADTLLIDPQGIYSPRIPEDRFYLGMKGSMSEMEVSLFRQRSRAAIREKASRGEYYHIIPAGYELSANGQLERSADEQVQEALQLVFSKFRELGSLRQATMWFRGEEIKIPVVAFGPGGRFIDWRVPGTRTLQGIITHPIYAGAYSYGRRKSRLVLEEGRKKTVTTWRRDPEEWDVLLREHHQGYITWDEYLANQEVIKHNANIMKPVAQGSVGKGSALLAGVMRCGHCGRKMSVNYSGWKGRSVQYSCKKNTKSLDGERCLQFTARKAEARVVESLLETLSPLGVEAALEAAELLREKEEAVVQQRRLTLERAQYESDRIGRQYDAVEPENRVVARQLEKRWNDALSKVSELERELEAAVESQEQLSAGEKETLLRLGEDFPYVWHHEAAPIEIKKRILRAVIKEIVVYGEEKRIRLVLHWEGGAHSELSIPRLTWKESLHRTDLDVVEIMRELAQIVPDKNIAQVLNRLGKRTAKGLSWNQARVRAIRHGHDIPVYEEGERERRGEMNMLEAARHLGVDRNVVKRLIGAGILPAIQACFGAPWIIRKADLEDESVKLAIENSSRRAPCAVDRNQETFNFQ